MFYKKQVFSLIYIQYKSVPHTGYLEFVQVSQDQHSGLLRLALQAPFA
jgi:hypothetical protein